MQTPTRAPGYDLFKLIVAVLLLILALILMWASPPQASVLLLITPSAGPRLEPASSTSPSETGSALPIPTPTETSLPEPTATPLPISTSPPLTATPPVETQVSEPTATPLPLPTATPVPQATAAPNAGATPAADVCEAARSSSRLQVGTNATILRRLNFRSSPGIRNNWLQTNIPGTQVKVIGGPECVPYWTGAYLWWQIRLPDGRAGWSAEGSLHGSFYFMEPR